MFSPVELGGWPQSQQPEAMLLRRTWTPEPCILNGRPRNAEPFAMMHISPLTYAVTSVFGAVAVIIWRIREGQTPVTLKNS